MLRRLCLALLLVVAVGPAAPAEEAAAPQPSPAQLQTLAGLLRDPAIQHWLEAQAEAAAPDEPPAVMASTSLQHALAQWLAGTAQDVRGVLSVLPGLPAELGRAWLILYLELQEQGLLRVVLLLAVFVTLGRGVEALYWRATAGYRQRLIAMTLARPIDRLAAVARRLAFGLGWVAAFAVGSVGAFLLFDWPPLTKEIVISYLLVFLIVRLVLVVGSFLFSPGAARFRIVPMSSEAARYWRYAIAAMVGWFAFGRLTLSLLATLGMSPAAVQAIRSLFSLVLLAIVLMALWRRPRAAPDVTAPPAGRSSDWLLTAVFIALWLCVLLAVHDLFWVGLTLLLLVLFLRGSERAAAHLLRPAEGETAGPELPSLAAVVLERGLRLVLLIGAALLIARALGVDVVAITSGESTPARLLAGLINATLILLVAEFAWQVLRSWIDNRLSAAAISSTIDAEEARRRARLRTLLPIARNVLLVTLAAIAVMMALASLGVQIGPLIAGAGVVGVAVGFGAQTLVKDVISGMFYLLDDAFRVGEYIQSGSYKGTVESFSLRSVKLRHHRGPLYTVPFGELGAVQNMSRDWVIDKMTVGVTYDTDIDKVKRVIKQISKELLADPELAPHFLEPLKMQGVDAFGDFAIQIRMKMTTKPGEQFPIRRRAYALIKKAFAANGIQFAFPTVTVAGGEGDTTPAVAQKAIELTQQPAPA